MIFHTLSEEVKVTKVSPLKIIPTMLNSMHISILYLPLHGCQHRAPPL